GNFDWYSDYRQHRDSNIADQIAAEPLIAAEGEHPTGLVLIRSGFARVSQRHGHGHRTLAYLGKGQTFGFDELAESYESGSEVLLTCSLRAVGYVDILRIPADVMNRIALPNIGLTAPNSQQETTDISQSEIRNPKSEIPDSL